MLSLRPLLFGTALACGSLVGTQADAAKPLSEKVTERVVESAIESGLEELARPENQARLGVILSSPAVTGGVHDIALALVDGVMDGFDGRLKLDVDSARFWTGFDGAMRKHVGPAVGTVTRNAVDSAMKSALSEDNGVRVEALVAHATRGAMRGLATGIREDLAPALAYSIEHELAPAGAAALENHLMPAFARGLSSPAMQLAIATTMSSVASNLVRGGDAGITSAKADGVADGDEGMFAGLTDRLSLGVNVALIAALSLAAVLILLAVLLVRSNRGQRRLAEQGKRREAELLAVVEQLDAEDPTFDRTAVRDVLKQHLRAS
jgi:hypothetical protein